MKTNHLFIIVASLLLVYGCKNNPDSSGSPDYFETLDMSVRPQDDFYQFAVGGWLEKNPLRDGEEQRSILGDLREETENRVRVIREKVEKDSVNEEDIHVLVSRLYVQEYFSPEIKQEVERLVKEIQVALTAEIIHFDWLTEETKEKAIEKVNHFSFHIGYPDEWEDFSGENTVPMNRVKRWEVSPEVVTAHYNEKANEFYFPAGILQPPFYYPEGDKAWNYGAMGVVIAHEMIHALNDKGREYNKEGREEYWWTPEDEELYNHKTRSLVEYFNAIPLSDSLYADGERTLNENFADLVGIQIAFKAFQNDREDNLLIDDFTPEQRFFIAYSVVKAANLNDAEIERITKTGVQSIGRWRVNGILPFVAAFRQAFDVQSGDGMYLNRE